jgi:adenosylhomocysteinase
VVAGFGWVGRGVAQSSRGLGARVIVTEVEGVKALEAHLDGFEVLPMKDAAAKGDVFLTCTGQIEVLREEHFELMKDGAILGNIGHFDREIDTISMKKKARKIELVRNNVSRIETGKKSLYLLCDGRIVNLVAAEGHPPEVMQLSFANQLLSLYYLVEHEKELRDQKPRLLRFPEEIDALVTDFALKGFDLKIDHLTSTQKKYSQSY